MDAAISRCYGRAAGSDGASQPSVHIVAGNLHIAVSTEEAGQVPRCDAQVAPESKVTGGGGQLGVNGGGARVSRIVVHVSLEDRSMCSQLHDSAAVMLSDRGACQSAARAADMEDECSLGDCRELGSYFAMLRDLGTSEPLERVADMEDEGCSRVSRELVSFFRELGTLLVFTRSWSSWNLREELTSEVTCIHNAMKRFWADTDGAGDDEDLLRHLARLLFKKRKRVESADACQLGHACASEEETWRAIRDVLEVRQSYLKSKGIQNLRYVLTSDERVEFTKRVRADFEESDAQRILQDLDIENGRKEFGGGKAKRKGSGKDAICRGAPQPATGEKKGRGREQDATGCLHSFLESQKRRRWSGHLKRICGGEQIWEMLAFTGGFEADMLRETVRLCEQGGEAEEETQEANGQHLCRLLRVKAEAQARYSEGRRLARQRDAHRDPSRSRGSLTRARRSRLMLSSTQRSLLQQWVSGELQRELNEAVAACEQRPVGSRCGEHSAIGDCTGGWSRRLADGWVLPDWRDLLPHSERRRGSHDMQNIGACPSAAVAGHRGCCRMCNSWGGSRHGPRCQAVRESRC